MILPVDKALEAVGILAAAAANYHGTREDHRTIYNAELQLREFFKSLEEVKQDNADNRELQS